jgi:hypothetical protein|tara:strand:- start:1251 stop:1442 length:192 start_codon:yes stop_codon:yes gene_type:complete
MRTYIYIVLIKDARTETVEVARSFMQRANADAFIAECERVETSGNYGYKIEYVQLDGDPLEGY